MRFAAAKQRIGSIAGRRSAARPLWRRAVVIGDDRKDGIEAVFFKQPIRDSIMSRMT
jgi:hypothetical protein